MFGPILYVFLLTVLWRTLAFAAGLSGCYTQFALIVWTRALNNVEAWLAKAGA